MREQAREGGRERKSPSIRRPLSSSTNRFRTTEVLKAATDSRKSRQIEGQAHTGRQPERDGERERKRQKDRYKQMELTYVFASLCRNFYLLSNHKKLREKKTSEKLA